jgi:high-affinity iron transporter
MLPAYLILLREALEAILIITIISLFLKKMNLKGYFKYLSIGVGLALSLCLIIASVIYFTKSEFPQSEQELLEGIIGFAAVGILTWMIFWMRKHGREIKGEVEQKITTTLETNPNKIGKVLVSMAFFAVIREGVESIVFLFGLDTSSNILVGALLGLFTAIVIGIGIYKGSHLVNLKTFFNVTSILIIFFAAGMFAGSFRKLAEAGVFYWQQTIAWDTSHIISNDGFLGTIFGSLFGYDATPAIAEALAYLIFLIPVLSIYIFTNNKKSTTPKKAIRRKSETAKAN